ncbi:MAG: 4Fe-4S dicluster domain-containing protein [Methanobacteriaceae archaeon]
MVLQIVIDEEKCTGCGECIDACPKGPAMWKVNRRTKKAEVSHLELCHVCTICASKCPEEAIFVDRKGDDA